MCCYKLHRKNFYIVNLGTIFRKHGTELAKVLTFHCSVERNYFLKFFEIMAVPLKTFLLTPLEPKMVNTLFSLLNNNCFSMMFKITILKDNGKLILA